MERYDAPETNAFDNVHTVEVTLQLWDYTLVERIEVSGNTKGFEIIECGVEFVLEKLCQQGNVVMHNAAGESLDLDDPEEDDLRNCVVRAEIVEVKRDEKPVPMKQATDG